mgnify:CR=1 FL=1
MTASAVRNGDSIAVAFQIVQGPQYRFGETYLSSPDKLRIKSDLVMRELLYQPGQIYKASRVADTIEDIYGTGLFSQVQMTPLPDSSNKVVEFDLRLRERSRRWFDTGVGSGTEERLRFTGEWGTATSAGAGSRPCSPPGSRSTATPVSCCSAARPRCSTRGS